MSHTKSISATKLPKLTHCMYRRPRNSTHCNIPCRLSTTVGLVLEVLWRKGTTKGHCVGGNRSTHDHSVQRCIPNCIQRSHSLTPPPPTFQPTLKPISLKSITRRTTRQACIIVEKERYRKHPLIDTAYICLSFSFTGKNQKQNRQLQRTYIPQRPGSLIFILSTASLSLFLFSAAPLCLFSAAPLYLFSAKPLSLFSAGYCSPLYYQERSFNTFHSITKETRLCPPFTQIQHNSQPIAGKIYILRRLTLKF